MRTATIDTDAVTLRDYLRVLRRRKWIVAQAALLVPLAAVAFSLHQQKRYQASADVLLSSQNFGNLPGAQLTGLSAQPDRITQAQASVARVPNVVRRVLRRVGDTGLTVSDFLADSSVSNSPGSDILTFAVTSPDPALSERLANAYARAYTEYRQRLDTDSIKRALADVDRRLGQLDRAGAALNRAQASFGTLTRYGALYTSLVERQQTLQSMQVLQTSNASVVRQASGTVLTQPKAVRNAGVGLLLGLVLGLGLAFLREALDVRVRTAEGVSARLGGLPLLGRVPAPPRRLRRAAKLVMLEEPASVPAEAFRMLRATLEFVRLDRGARSLIVTSALQQEGKSTTVANLAVALARAGQRVVLVDLDLRRPYLHRFFDLDGAPGFTQVALGRATLEEALVPVPLDAARPGRLARVRRQPAPVAAGIPGRLFVVGSGPIPPDPGEFVATHAVTEMLDELSAGADTMLVDAPPLLHVGDAMTLSAKVDAAIVVTRLEWVRRPMLAELHRLLETIPSLKLGFVITGAHREGGYGYGNGALAYTATTRVKEPV